MPQPPDYTVADTKPLTFSVGMDVTGANPPEVHVKMPAGDPLTLTGSWTDAATGAGSADWPAGGVPAVDRDSYASVEVQVTFSGGQVQTVAGANIRIRKQIA